MLLLTIFQGMLQVLIPKTHSSLHKNQSATNDDCNSTNSLFLHHVCLQHGSLMHYLLLADWNLDCRAALNTIFYTYAQHFKSLEVIFIAQLLLTNLKLVACFQNGQPCKGSVGRCCPFFSSLYGIVFLMCGCECVKCTAILFKMILHS